MFGMRRRFKDFDDVGTPKSVTYCSPLGQAWDLHNDEPPDTLERERGGGCIPIALDDLLSSIDVALLPLDGDDRDGLLKLDEPSTFNLPENDAWKGIQRCFKTSTINGMK
jgi:hypothetical protein